ncbi:hypothetical protein PROAA_550011 [Candidatus Propionivibrio aalborgensis]|uniref:Uncharacterized protein n=1 Tax=Candidatus Propionivibrio aalborgensis TaxID=1860101 RepID=A0A1A8Y0T7_9RHOO|nr:hypothetical protein PROAA_550011 [Candidatus Propionivibrio aalborgensis]
MTSSPLCHQAHANPHRIRNLNRAAQYTQGRNAEIRLIYRKERCGNQLLAAVVDGSGYGDFTFDAVQFDAHRDIRPPGRAAQGQRPDLDLRKADRIQHLLAKHVLCGAGNRFIVGEHGEFFALLGPRFRGIYLEIRNGQYKGKTGLANIGRQMDFTLDCAGLNHMTVTESGKGASSIYEKTHIRLLGSNHVADGLRCELFCRPNSSNWQCSSIVRWGCLTGSQKQEA